MLNPPLLGILFNHLHPHKASKQNVAGSFSVSLQTFCTGVKDFPKCHKQHELRPLLVSFFPSFPCVSALKAYELHTFWHLKIQKKKRVLKYPARLQLVATPGLPSLKGQLSIGVGKESFRWHHLCFSPSPDWWEASHRTQPSQVPSHLKSWKKPIWNLMGGLTDQYYPKATSADW